MDSVKTFAKKGLVLSLGALLGGASFISTGVEASTRAGSKVIYSGGSSELQSLVEDNHCSWRSSKWIVKQNPLLTEIEDRLIDAHWIFGQRVREAIRDKKFCLTTVQMEKSESRYRYDRNPLYEFKTENSKDAQVAVTDGGVVFLDAELYNSMTPKSKALLFVNEVLLELMGYDSDDYYYRRELEKMVSLQGQLLKNINELYEEMLDDESFLFALEMSDLKNVQLDTEILSYQDFLRFTNYGLEEGDAGWTDTLTRLRLRKKFYSNGLIYDATHFERDGLNDDGEEAFGAQFNRNLWIPSVRRAMEKLPFEAGRLIESALLTKNVDMMNSLIGEYLLHDEAMDEQKILSQTSGVPGAHAFGHNNELRYHFQALMGLGRLGGYYTSYYGQRRYQDPSKERPTLDHSQTLINLIEKRQLTPVSHWSLLIKEVVKLDTLVKRMDIKDAGTVSYLKEMYPKDSDKVLTALINEFNKTSNDFDILTLIVTNWKVSESGWTRIVKAAFKRTKESNNGYWRFDRQADDADRILRALKNFASTGTRRAVLQSARSYVQSGAGYSESLPSGYRNKQYREAYIKMDAEWKSYNLRLLQKYY